MIGHLDKAKNFYASIQEGAEAAAKKIEKILTWKLMMLPMLVSDFYKSWLEFIW